MLQSLDEAQRFWLDPIAMQTSAQHLTEADDALTWAADHFAHQYLAPYADHENKHITIQSAFITLPRELQRRLLLTALAQLDTALIVRGETLDSALSDMALRKKTMCGNWLIIPDKNRDKGWRIEPAPPRHQSSPLA